MATERYRTPDGDAYYSIAETAAELNLQPGYLGHALEKRNHTGRVMVFLGLTVADYEKLRVHYGVKGPAMVPEAAGFPGMVSSHRAQDALFAQDEFEHPANYRKRRARLNVEFEDVLKRLGIPELRIPCLNEKRRAEVLADKELHAEVRDATPPPGVTGIALNQWRIEQHAARERAEEERAARAAGKAA